jgi:hypothetical protein
MGHQLGRWSSGFPDAPNCRRQYCATKCASRAWAQSHAKAKWPRKPIPAREYEVERVVGRQETRLPPLSDGRCRTCFGGVEPGQQYCSSDCERIGLGISPPPPSEYQREQVLVALG